jgi:hypothetical protein
MHNLKNKIYEIVAALLSEISSQYVNGYNTVSFLLSYGPNKIFRTIFNKLLTCWQSGLLSDHYLGMRSKVLNLTRKVSLLLIRQLEQPCSM